MIEGIAILLVVAVSLPIYLSARTGANNFARQRMIRGEQLRWDHLIMDQLSARFAELDRQLVEKAAAANRQLN